MLFHRIELGIGLRTTSWDGRLQVGKTRTSIFASTIYQLRSMISKPSQSSIHGRKWIHPRHRDNPAWPVFSTNLLPVTSVTWHGVSEQSDLDASLFSTTTSLSLRLAWTEEPVALLAVENHHEWVLSTQHSFCFDVARFSQLTQTSTSLFQSARYDSKKKID
jgi:hypothetical protein